LHGKVRERREVEGTYPVVVLWCVFAREGEGEVKLPLSHLRFASSFLCLIRPFFYIYRAHQ